MHARSPRQPAIRVSKTLTLTRAIGMGSSLTIGLGIFVLLNSFLQQGGLYTPLAYPAAVVLFLPLVLTYAERAAVIPGGGGAFNLVRATGSTWRTYASGWLLLGGHLALIALLAWGAALYLHITLVRLLTIAIDMRLLAPAMIIIVALNDLIGTQGRWRFRAFLVYCIILFLLVVTGYAWLLPPNPTTAPVAARESADFVRLLAMMSAMLWGCNVILDSRDKMHQPAQNMLPALLVPLLSASIIGAFVAFTELRLLGDFAETSTHITRLIARTSFANNIMIETFYVFIGLLISLIALDRALVAMLRLIGTMVQDGFIPQQFFILSSSFGTPMVALRMLAMASALIAAFVPKQLLIGLTGLMLLWTTVLLNAPDMLGVQSRLPEKRMLVLPLHPLLPALATAIGFFLPFAMPPAVMLIGAGWGVLGLLYYIGYAHHGSIAARRRGAVVGDVAGDQRRDIYTVLVAVANPDTTVGLIRAGAALARARAGRMLVLRVVLFPDQVPQELQRQSAEHAWRDLFLLTQCADSHDTSVEVLVRMAQSPVDGILGTAQEERASLLLLGWEGEHHHGPFDLDPVLDPVLRAATCDVVILRGCMPIPLRRILVAASESPHSLAALHLAQELADQQHGQVVALSLLPDAPSASVTAQAKRSLHEMVQGLNNTPGKPPVKPRLLQTEDVKERLVQEAQHFDMVVMGASRGGPLDRTIFGGLPVAVAHDSAQPTLLVKHYEGAHRFWLRRVWEWLSAPFPSLTLYERADIHQQMRRATHPGIDFFVLIGLASMIATLGLVLNSPAVIIGAMLVAPLMSPILAMAMSIVEGDLHLLQSSTAATLLGVVMAVSVSMMITLFVPTHITSSEILARTQPNLLDLLVALASGAAGGYAMGRKEVAAALPGVAIAAALVPPLGVLGYGTATAQLDIAGGSLLLFTTNLIAIIFAAALIFLLLGFRPLQAVQHKHVGRGLLLSILAVLIISIPLGFFSVNDVIQLERQNQIEAVLIDEVESESARVTEIVVEREPEGFEVYATIYAYNSFDEAQIRALQEQLSATVGTPVTLHATVLKAVLLPGDEVLVPTPTLIP